MWQSPRTWLVLAIFALTYVLVSGRRLGWLPIGRPAGALLGAVAMVLCGALTPQEAYADALLNHDTLVLLLGTMLISAHLEEGGFFTAVATLMDRHATHPRTLLRGTAVVGGLLSALLVNDTVCVLLSPLLLRVVAQRKLPALPYVMALGCGANVGCALTLVGNPQNMLIAAQSHIPFTAFLLWMALPVGAALLCLVLLLEWLFKDQLRMPALERGTGPLPPWRPMVPGLLGLGLAVAGFLGGFNMAWSALAGASLALLWRRQDPQDVFQKVDFQLLMFFGCLFIVVGALRVAGLTGVFLAEVRPVLGGGGAGPATLLAVVSVVGSQVFSNVPFVQVMGPVLEGLPDARLSFLVLSLASTLAGNLTPVGSVANVIVLEHARRHGQEVGFGAFVKRGVPITLVTLVVSMALLLAEHAWWTSRAG